MASKKKELALQITTGQENINCTWNLFTSAFVMYHEFDLLLMLISNQELWEEMLSSKGLIVVDAYQGWCGPCKTVVSLFRKIRNELGDDLLHFAVAEVDSIDALEKYRGKCEPTFLFYAGGELVAVVRGANAPLLQKTIVEQLEAERRVLDHGVDRVVIQDEGLPKEEERPGVGEEEEEEEDGEEDEAE